MNSSLINIQDVCVTLPSIAGDVDILHNVNMVIEEGQSISIVGPSGSGKTTLLMVMAGLEKVTSGQLTVCGKNLSELNEDELALLRGQNIGIVFQSFHLVPTMTAIENVALPLEFLKSQNSYQQACSALDDVGLSHRYEHFPSQLSGGEQQRVALARALVSKPKLLLADEPTGNLDGKTGALIIDLMFDLRKKLNTTLVLITHDTSLANRCDRHFYIQDGYLRTESPHLNVVK